MVAMQVLPPNSAMADADSRTRPNRPGILENDVSPIAGLGFLKSVDRRDSRDSQRSNIGVYLFKVGWMPSSCGVRALCNVPCELRQAREGATVSSKPVCRRLLEPHPILGDCAMSYKVLARKYRPQSFDAMIGQEAVVKTLKNALSTVKIHPAYIFSGIRGVGKTTAARLFAKGLNCSDGVTATPCGKCASCLEIARGRSMDVLEIDGATHTKAEEARDLTQAARYAPVRDRYRVFIIDEVHMLSKAAFNALLKTLEEPPKHVVFLLATTEPGNIPETIRSRAQHFQLRRVSSRKVAAFLGELCTKEETTADPAALDLVARSGEGSVRDSLTLLDRLLTYSDGKLDEATAVEALGVVGREGLFRILETIAGGDAEGVSRFVDELRDKGRDVRRFLDDLVDAVREVLRSKVGVEAPPGYDSEGAASRAAGGFSLEDLMRLWDLLLSTQRRMKGAPAPEALLELQLVKAAMLPKILPLDQLMGKVDFTGKGKKPVSKDARGTEDRDLAFKALIPFKRMNVVDAKSYKEDSRLTRFRETAVRKMPLLARGLKDAELSVDPDGVLHIRLSPDAATAVALLATDKVKEEIGALAIECGLPGNVAVENGKKKAKEAANASAKETSQPNGPVKTVLDVLGGRILGFTPLTVGSSPGGEDGEHQ